MRKKTLPGSPFALSANASPVVLGVREIQLGPGKCAKVPEITLEAAARGAERAIADALQKYNAGDKEAPRRLIATNAAFGTDPRLQALLDKDPPKKGPGRPKHPRKLRGRPRGRQVEPYVIHAEVEQHQAKGKSRAEAYRKIARDRTCRQQGKCPKWETIKDLDRAARTEPAYQPALVSGANTVAGNGNAKYEYVFTHIELTLPFPTPGKPADHRDSFRVPLQMCEDAARRGQVVTLRWDSAPGQWAIDYEAMQPPEPGSECVEMTVTITPPASESKIPALYTIRMRS